VITALVIAAALAAGYLLGRLRPIYRAVRWANWEACGSRPTGIRLPVVWALLTAENLAVIATHPVGSWHAWQHRHDPPLTRSPAPQFDPNWAATRTTDPGDEA
jgi:hypothetical protein